MSIYLWGKGQEKTVFQITVMERSELIGWVYLYLSTV